MKALWLLPIGISVFYSSALGQITLNADMVYRAGFTLIQQELDSQYLAGIDLRASAGEAQLWNFSALIASPAPPDTLVISSPDQSAYADEFPEANLAIVASPTLFDPEEVAYFDKSDEALFHLGTRDPDLLTRNLNPVLVFPFPLDTGTSFEQEYLIFRAFDGVDETDTAKEVVAVDAWGEVRTPLGNFECLRLKREREESRTVFGLPLELRSTTWEFWTREYLGPVFTYRRTVRILLGVAETFFSGHYLLSQDATSSTRGLGGPAIELIAWPNPNPASTLWLDFHLPAAQNLRLAVFDAQGRQVRVDALGHFPEGRRQATSAIVENLPAGTYFLIIAGDQGHSGGAKFLIIP
jgi:hypothetical protein